MWVGGAAVAWHIVAVDAVLLLLLAVVAKVAAAAADESVAAEPAPCS